MQILYITHTDMKRVSSGSGVRPVKMLKALNSLPDTHVTLVCGNPRSLRKPFFDPRAQSRRKAVAEMKQGLPDLCYVESTTSGAMAAADRQLVAKLSRKGVPVGYFYRDAHAKVMGVKWLSGGDIKQLLRGVRDRICARATDRFLSRYANIVYFPSVQLGSLFGFKDKRLLLPAADGYNETGSACCDKTLIYVGGLSELYGTSVMLEAMRLLSLRVPDVKLILVCRSAEYKRWRQTIQSIACIEPHFADGPQLEPLYAGACGALYTLGANAYTQLSVSVKIFEYLAHGLPIIATRTGAGSELIENNNLGVLCEADSEALARAAEEFLNDKSAQRQLRSNVKSFVLSGNTWADRAQQLVRELSACKTSAQNSQSSK